MKLEINQEYRLANGYTAIIMEFDDINEVFNGAIPLDAGIGEFDSESDYAHGSWNQDGIHLVEGKPLNPEWDIIEIISSKESKGER